jgi:hypothetical protein
VQVATRAATPRPVAGGPTPTPGSVTVPTAPPARAGLVPTSSKGVAKPPERLPTPRLLKRLRLVSVVLMVFATVVGALAMSLPADRVQSAYSTSQQNEHVTSVQASLAAADAHVAMAFLDPAGADAHIAAFSSAMDAAYADLLRAAGQNREDLVEVASGARAYEDTVEDLLRLRAPAPASDAARDQVPVAELAAAHDRLWTQLEPALDSSLTLGPGTATSALVIIAIVVAGLSALLWVLTLIATARRTHRIFNLGYMGAILAVAALIIELSAITGLTNQQTRNHEIVADQARVAQVALTAAWRTQAADALAALSAPAAASALFEESSTALKSAWAAYYESGPYTIDISEPLQAIEGVHTELSVGAVTPATAAAALTGDAIEPWQELAEAASVSVSQSAFDRVTPYADASLVWVLITSVTGLIGLFLGLIGFRTRLSEYQ